MEAASVHPLGYLPYSDTNNWTAPLAVDARFNRIGGPAGVIAARLLFGAGNKREGDLQRLEVDLMQGATILSARIVDFNDKTTINEGIGDALLFVNDIGVEGYQTSNMIADGRADLKYGVLVQNLPATCDTLIVRVVDVKGNLATSGTIAVPVLSGAALIVDFENGALSSSGWTTVTSATGAGTTVVADPAAAHGASSFGMLSTDASTTESATQRAGIEYASLPAARFEWTAEGWFQPSALGLGLDQSVYPLYYKSGSDLSVAARMRNESGIVRPGLIAKKPDSSLTGSSNTVETVAIAVWKKWTLQVMRIGTRETTAALYMDDIEVTRLNWDSTLFEPASFRTGIGLTSAGATATLHADDIQVVE
jgi:hypothetical protein